MARLIDADALKYKQQVTYKKGDSDELFVEWFITATEIDNAPTVDAVQVVRCKDCFLYGDCKLAQFIGDDGYCSCGKERR